MLAIGWPTLALAATASTTFTVQITITNACQINSASNITFPSTGVITVLGVSATGTINVQCTLLAPYSISLGPGAGSGATVASRKLTNSGGATITYSLYQDVTHLLVWGDTVGTNTVGSVGLGVAQPFTVYAFIPSQTTPAADTYSDTINVTVTF